ncbi:MAG: 1-acyl-sn-glycerol-3-phosphate acyltransferase [Desulfatiglandaceae bacterium]
MVRKRPYFPFILDYKPRFFLGWFLYRLFKRVRLNQDMAAQLKQINREGTVVYAVKYRSGLDYLLYHFRFLKSRLPFPKLAFDLNMALVLPLSDLFNVLKFHISHFVRHGRLPDKPLFFEAAVKEGITSMLCLVDPKGFRKHYLYAQKDYLHLLLETQKSMDKPITIVPLLVLYKKAPEKEHPTLLEIFFGFKDKPGTLRKIMLFFRHNRRAFIDFGTPVNLKTVLEEKAVSRPMEETAEGVRQTLIDSIDRQKRIILGPVMKSRQQLKEKVLKDPTVTKTLRSMALSKQSRLKSLKKEASRYFDEIAADYNIAYIEFANMVLTWIWKKMFEGIEVNEEEMATVRAWAGKGPLIYIPSHKSHIDYLVLNYILYHHHMHIPRVAAGKNLNFWPMGTFFRKSGAFFIRRSFKGERLYAVIFKRYIKALLQEGHPLEFFIEGGRSRSGKLILPKIGFLSILTEAYKEGYCEDLIFVPASIVYDRIIEEKAYLKELSGDHKQGETFHQVVRARRFLKKKYGKIYIRFGAPISIQKFLIRHQEDMTSEYKVLAFDLIRSINRVTLVTPFALMATAILTRHRRGFHFDELIESTQTILAYLEQHHAPMASTLNQHEKAMMETLAALLNSGVVNALENVDRSETFYYLSEEKIPELAYYKNSIIHYFIPHTFVALSLLAGKEEIKTPGQIRTDHDFLKNVFRYEFIYDETKNDTEKMDEAITYFMDAGFIVKDEIENQCGYRLTKLGYDALPLWAELIKPFVESYWIAASAMIQDAKREKKRSDMVKNMNYLGQRFNKQGVINHIEAVNQLNFQNAVRLLKSDILKPGTPSQDATSENLKRLSRFSHRLRDMSQKIG